MSKIKVARSGKRNTMPAAREPEPASEQRIKAAAPAPAAPAFINVERSRGSAASDLIVGVGAGWFESAFEVAFGNRTSEALERFHGDLSAALDLLPDDSLGSEHAARYFREAVTRVVYRMSVAAEWAERVERLQDLREAAK